MLSKMWHLTIGGQGQKNKQMHYSVVAVWEMTLARILLVGRSSLEALPNTVSYSGSKIRSAN
jgi:hypothetical protein